MAISELIIKGYRSLRGITWNPGLLNVVIGPNGSGKSNLLDILELLSISAKGGLGDYIQRAGGMIPLLWDGKTRNIEVFMDWDTSTFSKKRRTFENRDGYEPYLWYSLQLNQIGTSASHSIEKELIRRGENLLFVRERQRAAVWDFEKNRKELELNDEETFLSKISELNSEDPGVLRFKKKLATWNVQHDFYTGRDAPIRGPVVARFEKSVSPNGQNLITVLHTLYTENRHFKKDIDTAMTAAFGDDFEELIFPPAADQRIQMRVRWKSLEREQSTADLSDGTLRFLYLITILANPEPGALIAIDEPETGLHPGMLPIIAEYAVEASRRTQVVFSTHSSQFLNAFTDTRPVTTVTKWQDGQTILRNVDEQELAEWLKNYSLGELFQSGELEEMG
jgi:predicted ATPase